MNNQTAFVAFSVGRQAPVLVSCRLLDCRQVFGRVEYLVEPVAGQGAAWVSENRISSANGDDVLNSTDVGVAGEENT